jgi:hypothetical protein
MVWKTWSATSYEPPRTPVSKEVMTDRQKFRGDLIALVGEAKSGQISTDGNKEHLESVYRINDEVLGYNIDGNRVLLRCDKNQRKFDCFVSLPFTKGVTERKTGRTLVILGSNAHHIEAMQGQFNGVLWDNNELNEIKNYGDTIRWINVGGINTGFIGVDYRENSNTCEGVARSTEDLSFLSKKLIEYGYDSTKRLFILKPPYIVESKEGIELRKRGLETLRDFSIQ